MDLKALIAADAEKVKYKCVKCEQPGIAPRSMYGLDKKGMRDEKYQMQCDDYFFSRLLCKDHLMEQRHEDYLTQTWCWMLLKRYHWILRNLYHTPDHDKNLLDDIETSFSLCLRGECIGCAKYPRECANIVFDRKLVLEAYTPEFIESWHHAQRYLIEKKKIKCYIKSCEICPQEIAKSCSCPSKGNI